MPLDDLLKSGWTLSDVGYTEHGFRPHFYAGLNAPVYMAATAEDWGRTVTAFGETAQAAIAAVVKKVEEEEGRQ